MEDFLWKCFIRFIAAFVFVWGCLIIFVGFAEMRLGGVGPGIVNVVLGISALVLARKAWYLI